LNHLAEDLNGFVRSIVFNASKRGIQADIERDADRVVTNVGRGLNRLSWRPDPPLNFRRSSTTSGVSSCEVYIMRAFFVIGGLTILTALSGCDVSHSDYPIVVANRIGNPISVFVNGNSFGQVGVGQVASFEVELQDSAFVTLDLAGHTTSPSPVSRVTFSARDQGTGALSGGRGRHPS
jgi:hypothetical protein